MTPIQQRHQTQDPEARHARPSVAIVVSHPIQHFCPMYSELSRASWLECKVFFASRAGLDAYQDRNFGREVKWEGLVLDFPHQFLDSGKAQDIDPSIDSPELDSALAEYAPVVVVIYGYRQALQRRALRWARTHGRPVLMISDSELRAHRALWRRAAKRLFVPRIYRQIDGFLSVGDANEQHYQHYGVRPERCFRSPFPIHRELFEERFREKEARRAATRKELDVDDSTILCTTVGKLVGWKRQRDLLMAVHRAGGRSRKIAALVVGTGPDQDELRVLAGTLDGGQVIMAGFVQPALLPDLYAATDIYVHTAEMEPHSLAISEAIFMGCPVLISDRCGSYGPSDDVQPGRNGLVYRCGDVAQLAAMMARMAEDRGLLEEMGMSSRLIAVRAQELANGGGLKAALQACVAGAP